MHEHRSTAPVPRRTAWRIAAAAIGLASIIGAAWWLHDGSQAAPAPGRSADASARGGARPSARAGGAQPVSIGVVQQRDMPVSVEAIGTIAAANTAVVHAKVSGELKAIYFAEGQPVRAGQVLALIDPRPFEIALAQARGQLARDQAQLRNAQLDLAALPRPDRQGRRTEAAARHAARAGAAAAGHAAVGPGGGRQREPAAFVHARGRRRSRGWPA